ncbi:MAG: hypothetical protein OEL83_17215 [Desulforhopalus sp.]|nr:hypothetical protein [Desulforhopalus sp.]
MFATNLPCSAVSLQNITFTNDWSLHPWESQTISDNLLQSFNRIGIIHKPILLTKENGTFDILCGYKRLLFTLTKAQMRNIDCLILPQKTQPTLLLDILLTDQCSARPLSLVEKAQFVEISSRFLADQDIIDNYFERLQLRKKLSVINDLKNILQFDPFIIAEIHSDMLQEKMVGELLRLQGIPDRLALVRLFKGLALGEGKQKRFFTLIRDISFRLGCTISAYLRTQEIDQILKHPELNIPQKIQHLKDLLQQQLNPLHSQAEDKFTKQVRDLQLPSHFTITHSPSFERDTVTLSIVCKSLSDCADLVSKINHFSQDR